VETSETQEAGFMWCVAARSLCLTAFSFVARCSCFTARGTLDLLEGPALAFKQVKMVRITPFELL
jgi:hypothetical protein